MSLIYLINLKFVYDVLVGFFIFTIVIDLSLQNIKSSLECPQEIKKTCKYKEISKLCPLFEVLYTSLRQ